MEPKDLKTITNLKKRVDRLEIDKAELDNNDLYFFYKDGTKKKMGKLSVSAVSWGGGEIPAGDFATKDWVLQRNYAPKSWVEDTYLKKTSLDEYAKKSDLTDFITTEDLDGYATESWVESQGYLTEHQSLSGYATEQWVEGKGYLTEHQSLEGYATEQYVDGKIPDLDGYATESWVESQGYLTEHQSLSGYATETWVQGQGYLTEHQSLQGYATEQWVEGKNYITSNALAPYYQKSGGNISGNVDIDGALKLNIADEDYDVDITFNRRLDLNRGTILTLNGAASGTPYKVAIENVGTPVNNNDAATKKYVDDLCSITWITGLMDNQGLIVSSGAYDKCYEAITTNKSCYLKITALDGVHVLRLKTWYDYNDHSSHGDSFLFIDGTDLDVTRKVLITYSSATYSEETLEVESNKVSSWSSTVNDTNYPSEKLTKDTIDALQSYIEANYTRKPVVVWEETDPANYLKGIQADLTATPAWQLTGLDFTPFARLKIYSCAGRGTGISANASTTPSMVLEMSLDPRAAIADYGGNYVATCIGQKPNDTNRLATLRCAVSADKTSFVVLGQTNLYGTGATNNNDVNANVFKIEGWYD